MKKFKKNEFQPAEGPRRSIFVIIIIFFKRSQHFGAPGSRDLGFWRFGQEDVNFFKFFKIFHNFHIFQNGPKNLKKWISVRGGVPKIHIFHNFHIFSKDLNISGPGVPRSRIHLIWPGSCHFYKFFQIFS